MFLKVKSPVFIDHLTFQVGDPQKCMLRAVLRDDTGIVCSALETEVEKDQQELDWNGLNDLAYGVYTLEIFRGQDEMKLRLVKRGLPADSPKKAINRSISRMYWPSRFSNSLFSPSLITVFVTLKTSTCCRS